MVIELDEYEAAALDALFGYSCDAFLELFYKHMGRAYLQPVERGFRTLHESRGGLSQSLEQLRKAREVFTGTSRAVRTDDFTRLSKLVIDQKAIIDALQKEYPAARAFQTEEAAKG